VRRVGAAGVRHGARCCQIRPPTLDLIPPPDSSSSKGGAELLLAAALPRDAEPLRSILAVVFVFSGAAPSPATVTTKLVRWRAGQQEEGPDATTFGGVVKVGTTTARDARRRSDPGRPVRACHAYLLVRFLLVNLVNRHRCSPCGPGMSSFTIKIFVPKC
jgi:hypothetical protein